MFVKKIILFENLIRFFYLVENGTIVNIPSIENEEEFWEIIRIFQNGILAGNDLFISSPPPPPGVNDSSLSLSPGLF
jgi:hypothetical protein